MRLPRIHFSLRSMLALAAAVGWCLACERTIVQQRQDERRWIVEHGGVVETAEEETDVTRVWRILGGEEGSPDGQISIIRRLLGDQPLWLITIPKRAVAAADLARIQRILPEAPLMLQDGQKIEFANPNRCVIRPSSGPWVVDVGSDEYDKP